MFLIEQRFQKGDLYDGIELIEPLSGDVSNSASIGRSVLVIVPERTRSVAISMVWGGGVPATDAMWDGQLNEGLRTSRCLIPSSSTVFWRDGHSATVRPSFGSLYLSA